MVILLEGLNQVRDLHGAVMEKFQLGTDGTAATETQTALQAAVAATKLTPTVTATKKTNTLNYTLPSTTGTGNTYREGGAIDATNSVDIDRVTFTGIAHTAASDIVIRKTYYYRNPE